MYVHVEVCELERVCLVILHMDLHNYVAVHVYMTHAYIQKWTEMDIQNF